MVPGKIYTAEWLRQGVLPLWNPTLFGGLPWLADINQSALYPSTLFFVVFEPAAALNLTILSHVFISGWGMYVLAQFWFAAAKQKTALSVLSVALWIASAQFINSFNNITFLQSLAWMPWFVYLGIHIQKHYKYAWGIMAVVLLQLLGGYPVHVLYSGLTAAVFSAYATFSSRTNRTKTAGITWILTWAGTTVASLGLTAFIWMPFLEVLSESTRTLQTNAQAVSGSLHPSEYIKLFIPYFFDNPKSGLRWGPGWNAFPTVSLYFPWITLVLGFFAVVQKRISSRIYLLAGLVVVPLMLALGEYLPGYSLLRQIPLFSLTRGPSLILGISAFSFSLLLAELLTTVSFKKISSRWVTVLGSAVGLVTLMSAGAYAYSRFSFTSVWNLLNAVTNNAFINSAFHTIERDQLISASITENMLVSSTSLLVVLYALTRLKRNFKWVVIILALSLEVLYGSKAMLWFGPARIYSQESSLVAHLPKDAQSRYLIRNYNAPYTEYGSYWEAVYVRKPFSDSYIDAEELKEFKHLQRMVDGLTPNMHMSYGFNSLNAYTTLVPLDVNQRWNATTTAAINAVPEIPTTHAQLPNWAVRYYLVDTFFPTTEDFSGLTLLLSYDFWKLYEVPGALSRFRFLDGTPAAVELVETPNSLDITLEATTSGSTLIVADRYDSNWQATRNGEPVEVSEVAGMRAVELVAGKNTIAMQYVPQKFFTGLLVSAGTLLLLFGAAFFKKHYFLVSP